MLINIEFINLDIEIINLDIEIINLDIITYGIVKKIVFNNIY